MKAPYQTGVAGEELAEDYLSEAGMRCLERRYREKCGEVDLIMEDGDTIVFVEVKARFSGRSAGAGLGAVTPSKQKRLARCATMYLMKHNAINRSVRFDVVEVNREGILHIPNAFQPGGMYFL